MRQSARLLNKCKRFCLKKIWNEIRSCLIESTMKYYKTQTQRKRKILLKTKNFSNYHRFDFKNVDRFEFQFDRNFRRTATDRRDRSAQRQKTRNFCFAEFFDEHSFPLRINQVEAFSWFLFSWNLVEKRRRQKKVFVERKFVFRKNFDFLEIWKRQKKIFSFGIFISFRFERNRSPIEIERFSPGSRKINGLRRRVGSTCFAVQRLNICVAFSKVDEKFDVFFPSTRKLRKQFDVFSTKKNEPKPLEFSIREQSDSLSFIRKDWTRRNDLQLLGSAVCVLR